MELPIEAYQSAENLLGHRRHRLELRSAVRPHWIDNGERFWYRVETEFGGEYVVVDPQRGERGPAFDQERLASALAAIAEREVDPFELPFRWIDLTPESVGFDAFGSRWECTLTDYRCGRVGATDVHRLLEVASPDGRWVAFRRDNDVWIRSVENGEERQLTSDGEEGCGYAYNARGMLYQQFLRNYEIPEHTPSLSWSPDSTRILTHRIDDRNLPPLSVIDYAPADESRPRLWQAPYPMPGEPLPMAQWVTLDIDGDRVEFGDPFPAQMLSPIDMGWTWWAEDAANVYFLEQERDRHTLRLRVADVTNGEVRTLIEEYGETRVEPAQEWGLSPMVAIIGNGREALWYSQKDGWGHLYLFDLGSGELQRQVTHGEFAVRQILHVDEEARVAYLQVTGLIDVDPYRRSLVRVDLDGGDLVRLDSDELDHALLAPPHGRWFVDSASTTEIPPVTTVRAHSGEVILELERADISRLLDTGWTIPERFCVLAADGKTKVYGILQKPIGFDPSKRYPVLNYPYPGTWGTRVLPCFEQVPYFGPEADAMTALGFAVLAMDGRGTAGRDKAFHDHSYRNFGSAGGIEDHVAALEQLSQDRPWMDMERIGICGVSGGGFATARAMLRFPRDLPRRGRGSGQSRQPHLSR